MDIEEEMDAPHLVEILDIQKVADETYRYKLACPKGYEWGCGVNTHIVVPDNAGQFKVEKKWTHHFSVSTFPHEGGITFTTRIRDKNYSPYKTSLSQCIIGDSLMVYGFQSRLPFPSQERPVVLVSMGVGITSFRTIILRYFKNPIAVPSIVSINVDKSGQWIYAEDLDVDDIKGYESIRVSQREGLFEQLSSLPSLDSSIFYIVGSDGFLYSVAKFLFDLGVKIEQTRFDKKPKFVDQLNRELSIKA